MADRRTSGSQGTGSLLWHAIKGAAAKFGIGTAANYVAPRLAPQTRWIVPGIQGVLEPMSALATRLAPFAPAVRAAGRFGARVGPFAPLSIVALNPTNRFPGGSAERLAVQRGIDVIRQQAAISRRNEDLMRNLAFQRREDAQRRSTLQLKPPQLPIHIPFGPATRFGANPMVPRRLEPFKLRPAPNVGTPFNIRLLRPSPRVTANPFGLSVMGRPSTGAGPFGLNLGSPQLRAPLIGH